MGAARRKQSDCSALYTVPSRPHVGVTYGADVSGWPSARPQELQPGHSRRHSPSSFPSKEPSVFSRFEAQRSCLLEKRLAEVTCCVHSLRRHCNRIKAPDRGFSRFRHQACALHHLAGRSMQSMANNGMAHPGSAVAKPSDHGSRVSPTVLLQHHLVKQRAMSQGSLSADSPPTQTVRWKIQLYRGPPRRGPAALDLRPPALPLACPGNLSKISCCVASKDVGASVSENYIRLPVHHSCRAQPWYRASPERHSARQPMAPSGTPAEFHTHRPLVHPAATRRHYCPATAVRTPSTGALGLGLLKGPPAAPSVSTSAASPFGRGWTPFIPGYLFRTSMPSTVSPYASGFPRRQACRPVRTAGRHLAASPRRTHQLAIPHPAVMAAADVDLVLGLASRLHVLDMRPSMFLFPLWPSATSTMGIIPSSSGSAASPCRPRASRIPSIRPQRKPSGVNTPSPNIPQAL